MELRADRFERQLASEPLRPAYLIAGTEPLIVLECADAVRAKARVEGYLEREVLEVSGRDFDWNDLTMGVASLSLFATRRLFDLRLPSGKPDKDGSKAITDFCADPPPDTILLITCQDWSQKHAGKWSDAISRIGHLVTVWPVKTSDLNDWLDRRLRSRGLSAERSKQTAQRRRQTNQGGERRDDEEAVENDLVYGSTRAESQIFHEKPHQVASGQIHERGDSEPTGGPTPLTDSHRRDSPPGSHRGQHQRQGDHEGDVVVVEHFRRNE